MSRRAGRHFLQIPGPTNVPDRILRAMDRPTIDHRGPAFARLGLDVLDGLRRVIGTTAHVFMFPSSGSGAWEAALVNTLSPGDAVLMVERADDRVLTELGHSEACIVDEPLRLVRAVEERMGTFDPRTAPRDDAEHP